MKRFVRIGNSIVEVDGEYSDSPVKCFKWENNGKRNVVIESWTYESEGEGIEELIDNLENALLMAARRLEELEDVLK